MDEDIEQIMVCIADKTTKEIDRLIDYLKYNDFEYETNRTDNK